VQDGVNIFSLYGMVGMGTDHAGAGRDDDDGTRHGMVKDAKKIDGRQMTSQAFETLA
jgi:hypothetical protein